MGPAHSHSRHSRHSPRCWPSPSTGASPCVASRWTWTAPSPRCRAASAPGRSRHWVAKGGTGGGGAVGVGTGSKFKVGTLGTVILEEFWQFSKESWMSQVKSHMMRVDLETHSRLMVFEKPTTAHQPCSLQSASAWTPWRGCPAHPRSPGDALSSPLHEAAGANQDPARSVQLGPQNPGMLQTGLS